MRVLVTGANGLVGTKVLEQLLGDPAHTALGAYNQSRTNAFLGEFPHWWLDVTDSERVRQVLDEARPDAVIHAGAFTNVDAAERERDTALAVNAAGTANLAQACAERDIRLVYLSTEYVFDGANGPYRETDPVHPLGWYAKTKEAGEQAVMAAGGRWAIGRTTVVYGYAPHVRANFVLWLVGKLKAGERVNIVHDQVGSPTLADNLAQMVLALAGSNVTGIFNTAGAEVVSRLQLSRQIAEVFGLDASLMDPITTAQLHQAAPRPLKAGLLMDKLRETFPDLPILGPAEGLAIVKRQFEEAGLV
ncbi:MAG: dTDP-4-dehydrorhamnose reductase [Chloroflexi bacterium]|nr:dTDP-4-dehydrorhamnose reductase [Chloroflexota bacterium]